MFRPFWTPNVRPVRSWSADALAHFSNEIDLVDRGSRSSWLAPTSSTSERCATGSIARPMRVHSRSTGAGRSWGEMSRNLRAQARLSEADTTRLELLTSQYIEYALVDVEPDDLATVEGIEMHLTDRHGLAAALSAEADILLAENARRPSRFARLDSDVDREVSPRDPKGIRDRPSPSVALDLFQRSQGQVLPPLQWFWTRSTRGHPPLEALVPTVCVLRGQRRSGVQDSRTSCSRWMSDAASDPRSARASAVLDAGSAA
jgi:hypothetical protein